MFNMFKKISIFIVLTTFLISFSGCGNKTYLLQFSSQNSETNEWLATQLNESYLISAEVQIDSYYQPFISLKFNEEGAKLFEEITEQNTGKTLGIFVRGELITAPMINERISGGVAVITGVFTKEEAEKLAKDINDSIK